MRIEGSVQATLLYIRKALGDFAIDDSALILCASHGALFEKATGLCVAGPCAGHYLRAVPLKVDSGFVMLGDSVDVAALAAATA